MLRNRVQEVLSEDNRHFTRQNLGLDREPTPDELLANYERHNIIMNVHRFTICASDDANQLPLFPEVCRERSCPECGLLRRADGQDPTCPHSH